MTLSISRDPQPPNNNDSHFKKEKELLSKGSYNYPTLSVEIGCKNWAPHLRIDPSRNGWAVEKLSAKSSMNLNFQSSVRRRPAQGEKKSEVDWRALDLITLLQNI